VKTQERSWKAVGEFIRSQRRLADLSLRQLSALAQVSNPYLSQIERGIHKPSADVLKGIADALHISAETLYARAGLLSADGRCRAFERHITVQLFCPQRSGGGMQRHAGIRGHEHLVIHAS